MQITNDKNSLINIHTISGRIVGADNAITVYQNGCMIAPNYCVVVKNTSGDSAVVRYKTDAKGLPCLEIVRNQILTHGDFMRRRTSTKSHGFITFETEKENIAFYAQGQAGVLQVANRQNKLAIKEIAHSEAIKPFSINNAVSPAVKK